MTTPLFTRRQVLAFGAALVPEFAFAKALDKRQLSLILAPSNLGLRPEKNGDQPGTWRAPEVLIAAGLRGRLGADKVAALDRPTYDFHEQAGTRIRNGYAIRRFSLELGQTVSSAISQGLFPIVIDTRSTMAAPSISIARSTTSRTGVAGMISGREIRLPQPQSQPTRGSMGASFRQSRRQCRA